MSRSGFPAHLLGRRTARGVADAAGVVGLISLFDVGIQLLLQPALGPDVEQSGELSPRRPQTEPLQNVYTQLGLGHDFPQLVKTRARPKPALGRRKAEPDISLNQVAPDAQATAVEIPQVQLSDRIALLGVEGLAVVDAGDSLLVARLDRSNDVRGIVKALKAKGRLDVT